MSLELSRVGIVPPHVEAACTPTEGMNPIQKLARETIKECLPALFYYYGKEKQNDTAKNAEEYTIQWLKTWLVKNDNPTLIEKATQKIQRERFSQFATHCSPNASAYKSKIAATLAVWLFFTDDAVEISNDKEELADQFERVKQICDNPGIVDESYKPTLQALADIAVRIHLVCGDALKSRFTKSVDGYLKSNLWELGNEEEGRTPPAEEYLAMRYFTSATPLSFHMIELDKDLNIPDEIYEDADVKELIRSGAFCCNNLNELISFEKEEKEAKLHNRKVVHNLVSVFMNEDKRAVSEEEKMRAAFKRTAGELLKEHVKFSEMAEKVKKRDFGIYSGQVAQLADGISDWNSAHLYWAVFAPRYGGRGWSAS